MLFISFQIAMKKFLVICILAGIAFINASYLTYKSYVPTTNAFCDINQIFSCSTVLASPVAKIGGVIPFPMIAMIVYPILFALAFIGRKKRKTQFFKPLAILATMGIAFNGYFIYLETTVIKVYCSLCLLCTAIIISIFVMSVIGRRQQTIRNTNHNKRRRFKFLK